MRFCSRAVLFCAALLFAFACPAEEKRILPGQQPAAAAHSRPLANLPPSTPLDLAIGLPLRNKVALADFLQQLYDPASPNFHHYLTPEQFTERFGPTEQDYRKVTDY